MNDVDAIADAVAERIRVPQRDRLIGLVHLADLCSCSKTTAARIAAKPGFPAAYRLGTKSPRWKYGEVVEWLESTRG